MYYLNENYDMFPRLGREPPAAMSLTDLLCSTELPLCSTNFILKLQKFFTGKGGYKENNF